MRSENDERPGRLRAIRLEYARGRLDYEDVLDLFVAEFNLDISDMEELILLAE